jgi:tRNA A-37 threonylcarbamoyl transferase component Bud32
MPKQRFRTKEWLSALAFALFLLVLAAGMLMQSRHLPGDDGPADHTDHAPVPAVSANIITMATHAGGGEPLASLNDSGAVQILLLLLMTAWLLLAVPRLATVLSAVGTVVLLLLLMTSGYRLRANFAAWQDTGLVVFAVSGYGLLWQRRKRRAALAPAPSSPSGSSNASADDPPALLLGRYHVEQLLGKGSMGAVYRAFDATHARTVAIKTLALSRQFGADTLEEAKTRLLREWQAVARLHHPNIVALIEAGEDGGFACLVMEFVAGSDLSLFTRPSNLLPVPQVLGLMADAAEALEHAHCQGVVHRDIKPANLLLPHNHPGIKLTDFGIVSIDGSGKAAGPLLGTPSYMSPEQLARKKVDGRSDLFSLGVTLYQLLTGTLPFQAESMATLMFKIANEIHTSPLILRPDLPPAVAAIIDKALAKSYEYRYQCGTDMARDLRALLQALQPGVTTPSAQG